MTSDSVVLGCRRTREPFFLFGIRNKPIIASSGGASRVEKLVVVGVLMDDRSLAPSTFPTLKYAKVIENLVSSWEGAIIIFETTLFS